MFKLKSSKLGFTLIEIIVVLIIVGVLAAIGLPALFSNVNKSRAHEGLSTLSSWRQNIEGCEQGRPGAEAGCNIPAPAATPSFAYAYVTAPANGTTAYGIQATGIGQLAGGGTITISRPNNGVATCLGAGTVLTGAC